LNPFPLMLFAWRAPISSLHVGQTLLNLSNGNP
jgi:hypothetical protein